MLFDDAIEQVWKKAHYISETNESRGFRKDQCGAWIQKRAYGNRDSRWGWEIDHITPVSKGGTDSLGNLRPLHWRNNAHRQNDRLVCVVQADGARNVTL